MPMSSSKDKKERFSNCYFTAMEGIKHEGDLHTCQIKLRENPQRRKQRVRIGCGAGFAGDRPLAALKLLQRVEGLDYLVLECLAERTLAERYRCMMAGGCGYDPRISDWVSLLLPLSIKKGVCIITNMGAIDPHGAQKQILDIAMRLGFDVTVALAYETHITESEQMVQLAIAESSLPQDEFRIIKGAVSTYIGAAPIVECLEKYKPHVIVTSRVADAALFLGPMVYELGWNWNDFKLLAQGSLAGHLLECGCQLTGGYFMHPGDKNRDLSFQQLLDLSLPFAEVEFSGEVYVAKAEGSGSLLNSDTCAEQLLYEVGDPSNYITPDMILDLLDVKFSPLSDDKVMCLGGKPAIVPIPDKLLQITPKLCGWKSWGEISYGGRDCVKRAKTAYLLVLSWMEERHPGIKHNIISQIIGLDSLKAADIDEDVSQFDARDVRLHMDGLFLLKEHALNFVNEFMALYTNGPAGGGGIRTGYNEEMLLLKELVSRESVFWKTEAWSTDAGGNMQKRINPSVSIETDPASAAGAPRNSVIKPYSGEEYPRLSAQAKLHQGPAPSGTLLPLYEVAHSRAGDKGNDLNFSIIPHFPRDISRLKKVITSGFVLAAMSPLLDMSQIPDSLTSDKRDRKMEENPSVEIYEVRGIHSLNIVVRNILDGGVNCSRRIDRHGKTISDLILSQKVMLPPPSADM